MRSPCRRLWYWAALLIAAAVWPFEQGCQALADRMTRWTMLGQDAPQDPVQAVGGDAIVFTPVQQDQLLSRQSLSAVPSAELVAYYAPVFVQQRVNTAAQPHPYPPEFDLIGEAQLRRDAKGNAKAAVAGPPTVYAIYQKVPID
jgi:hypothetical protein